MNIVVPLKEDNQMLSNCRLQQRCRELFTFTFESHIITRPNISAEQDHFNLPLPAAYNYTPVESAKDLYEVGLENGPEKCAG